MQPIDLVQLAGRILLGGYFLMAAYNHFAKGKMMIGYAASKGIPAPPLAIYGTGIILGLGSISLLTGIMPIIGLGLLAVFLIGVTPTMHNFWKATDPMAKMNDMNAFMKNTALLGALLMLSALNTPWAFAL